MLAQRRAVEQLRHHIRRGVQPTDVMDDEDIWMIQRARRPRLLLEPAESLGIAAHSDGSTLIATSRRSRLPSPDTLPPCRRRR